MIGTARNEQSFEALAALGALWSRDAPFAATAAEAMSLLAAGFEWVVAGLWVVDAASERLRFVAAGSARGEHAAYAAASRRWSFAPGEGFPGQVWSRRATLDGPRLPAASDASRFAAARGGGGALVGRPVYASGAVVGVVECFAAGPTLGDERSERALAGALGQIGQFIARNQSERRLRASETRGATLLASMSRTEDDLRESHRFIASIAEVSPVALYVFDRESRHTIFANRGVTSILGYTLADLQRMGESLVSSLVHPDDQDRCAAMPARLAATAGDAVESIELRVRRADGAWRWVMSHAAVLRRDATGAPCQVVCAALDITDRKQAELDLQAIRQRYALATSAARVGVWDIDLVRGSVSIDPPASLMLGFDGEGYRRHEDWVDRIHPADRAMALSHEQAIFDPDTPRGADGNTPGPEIEYRVIDRDGKTHWIADRATVVRDGDGLAVRIVGTITDISERKRGEDALRRLTGQLLSAQDDERRRIARELHDGTAQDLAAIGVDLLRLDRLAPDLPDEARSILRATQDHAQRALTDLRVLAFLLHPPLLDLVGLTAAIRWYAEGFAARSGIAVEIDGVAEIGRLPSDVETALYRVVQESLANVQRHSGGDCAAIRLERGVDGVMLDVRDCGRGLPTDASSGRNEARPGVGIASMRQRLQRLGGRLELHSCAAGVTVVARVPAAVLAAEERER